MVKKYFISCINQTKQLGAMQFEAEEGEFQKKSEDMCPKETSFRAYIVDDFDESMPINEFVPIAKLKKLGY